MAHDGVVNVVMRLMNSGFDPRKVGADAWESRCPAHRSADHVLSITRGDFNHVALECRSVHNCALAHHQCRSASPTTMSTRKHPKRGSDGWGSCRFKRRSLSSRGRGWPPVSR